MDVTVKGGGARPDIQYLRAFAVLAVLIFHYWPHSLRGGYVGVDVFFGISGFLITDHLLREYSTSGRVHVTSFWARRVRRLLPASLTVIAVVTALTLTVVPKNLVGQYLSELFASAFYFENWRLASDFVDYLAAENSPSPVQHFWSLGVEEQFYLVWPLVIALCVVLAKLLRLKGANVLIAVGVTAIAAWSLNASITQTDAQLPSAYFETTTRAWELALGALLAISGWASRPKHPVLLALFRSLGWAGLALSVIAFNSRTPFPGFTAALPVCATLLVIAYGDGSAVSPARLARVSGRVSTFWLKVLTPFRFIGDISYSVYLWHWPLLILAPFVLGLTMGRNQRFVLFAIAILLGWASKRFVEDPLRRTPLTRSGARVSRPNLRVFAAAAAAMGILAAVIVPVQAQIATVAAGQRNEGMRLFSSGTACFGAAAWDASDFDCDNNGLADKFLTPDAASIKDDVPFRYKECQNPPRSSWVTPCVYGKVGGTRVAIAGDSHAFQWLEPVLALAEERGWEVHTFARSSCPFSQVMWQRRVAAEAASCVAWNKNLDEIFASEEPYKYVFTSFKAAGSDPGGNGATKAELAKAGFNASWQPLIDRGAKIIAIHDVPRGNNKQAECVLKHPKNYAFCSIDERSALRQTDWLSKVAAEVSGAYGVDLTKFFCRDGVCPQVVGHTFTYRDGSHVSATYARTLAPFIAEQMAALGLQ